MSDKDKTFQPTLWTLYNARRLALSILGSELISFVDAYDMAYSIQHDLQGIMNKRVHLTVYADRLSLFDVLTETNMTPEKHPMIF